MPPPLIAPTCPHCHSRHRQPKWGFTAAGSQMHRCHDCGRTYTPDPKAQGHPDALRRQAVTMSLDGVNQRRVGRLLSVNQQSVANRLKAYHEGLVVHHPAPTQPEQEPERAEPPEAQTVELDELYTFVGSGR